MYEGLVNKVVVFPDDLLRNIKTIRDSQALFDDLSADSEDLAVAIAAESADRIPSVAPLITRPFGYGAVICYPFVHLNGRTTRFSDGLHYGVWYGSLDLKTTVDETAYHWHRFAMDGFAAEDRVTQGKRRVFKAHCDALLIDLRGKERRERRLTVSRPT